MHGTGAAFLATFIVTALPGQEKTEETEHIDVSLLDFSLSSLTTVAGCYFAKYPAPERRGSASPNFGPNQAFATVDGWSNVCGSGSEEMRKRLCGTLARENLFDDERFPGNNKCLANEAELVRMLPPSSWETRVIADRRVWRSTGSRRPRQQRRSGCGRSTSGPERPHSAAR